MSVKKTITKDYIINFKADVTSQYTGEASETQNFAVHVRRSGSNVGAADYIGYAVTMDKKQSSAGSAPSENTTLLAWSAPQDDTGETNMGCLYLLSSSAEASVGTNAATTNRWGSDIGENPVMRLTASDAGSPANGGSGQARYIGSAIGTWSSSTEWPLRHTGVAVDCNVWDSSTTRYIHRVFAGSPSHYALPSSGGKNYIGAVHIWDIPAGTADNSKVAEYVLTASDAAAQDRYGSDVCTVTNGWGSYFFVAAPNKTVNTKSGQGLVYAYAFDKSVNPHLYLASLQSPVNEASAYWANALSADGTLLVGGMYNKSKVGIYRQTSATAWTAIQTLTHPSGTTDAAGWYYGADVSVSGDYIAVGAPKDRTTEGAAHTGAGHVYIYKSGSSGFVLEAEVYPDSAGSNITRGSHFGASVSLDGKYLLVGQPHYDIPELYPGRAYVYESGSSGWSRIKTIEKVGSNTYAYLGGSVATKGGVALVGSHNDHATTNDSGASCGIANIYDATVASSAVDRGQPFRFGAKTVSNIRGVGTGTNIRTTTGNSES